MFSCWAASEDKNDTVTAAIHAPDSPESESIEAPPVTTEKKSSRSLVEEKLSETAPAAGPNKPTVISTAGDVDHKFTARLTREAGQLLGIKANYSDKVTLLVQSVDPEEATVVAAWNRNNPEQAIKVGDRIVEVNDVKGNAQSLLKELTVESKILECIVRRSTGNQSVMGA